MAHVSKEMLQRLVTGEVGEVEVQRLAQHALACQPCQALVAGHLEDMVPRAKRDGPLKTLAEFIRRENETAVETLVGRAECFVFRRLPRKSQRDRVIQSRPCHSSAFLEILLAELCSA